MTKKDFLSGAKFRTNNTFPTVFFYKDNTIYVFSDFAGEYQYVECEIFKIFKTYFTVIIKGYNYHEVQCIPFESLILNSIPIKEVANE